MATMTMQSRRTVPSSSYRFPLSSNTAGAPLPIPRRTRSAPVAPQAALNSLPVSALQPIPSSAIADDSDSSTSPPSDGSRLTIRTKRERGLRIAVAPSHDQTGLPSKGSSDSIAFPTSSSPPSQSRAVKGDENVPPSPPKPLIYAPGMLRLVSRSPPNRVLSDSSAQGGSSMSAPTTSTVERPAPVIRKKSGQLVKPSLKTSKSGTRGSLTVVTTVGTTSKSEPATPSCKAVHFDTQLEHVKLFLAEQKPAAVSRDGSPTDDTSGTESDFPSFIYGDKEDKRKLLMRVINMPSIINMDADVALEEIALSQDGASILGRVRVCNIDFAKWVAIRFTFDSWQTTSEVVGTYMDSVNAFFDRFSFSIKLSDLLARIEEKTLFLAVRYCAKGREMWDNNNGRNYQATFSRVKPSEKRRSRQLSDDEGSASDVADLHSKLEKVVEGKTRTGPAFLAQNSNSTRRNSAGVLDQAPPIFRTSSNSSFSSRYDFNASLKQPWQPASSPGQHTRAISFPSATSTPSSSIPWPQKGAANSQVKPIAIPILGSPRDLDHDIFNPTPRVASDLDDTPFSVGPRQRSARNHQRGYFDLNIPAGVRMTPPGSPVGLGDRSPGRFHSFPPLDSARSTSPIIADPLAAEAELSEDSAVSTPSLTSPSSSASSSPTEPFLSLMLGDVERKTEPVESPADYSQLINQFCFYTGTGIDIPRTQSASIVKEFLAGTSPRDSLDATTPTQSSTLDDIFSGHSGPTTPTNDRCGPILSGLSTPTYGMY